MGEIKIIDLEGRWVVNPHAFPFVDPETGVRFTPQVRTKVAYGKDSWVAGQIAEGVLALAADPMKPEKEPPKVETPKAPGKAEG